MNMANSDYLLYKVLTDNNGSQLTFEDIKRLLPVPMSDRTINRVIKRLVASKQVERIGRGRGYIKGSRYVIK